MINYVNSALFTDNSIDKQLNIVSDDGTVVITNTELHENAFELEEKICDESTLVFGLAEPSVLRFTISNVFTPMKNKWITAYTTLNRDLTNPFIFGRYKVQSDKPTADRKKREIVAYDALYDILNADVTNWYNNFFKYTAESTLKTFRNSFFSNFGISEVDVVLPNDSMKIKKTIDPKELSGKTVLNAICEINGCFGHIGRDGKFKYVFLEKMSEGLYPSHELYPSEDLYPAKPQGATIGTSQYIPPCTYEDYVTDRISGVQIRQEEDDIGAIAGSTSNPYIIQDNFLVYGKGSDELLQIARNVLNVIKDIVFRPFSTKAKGNPCIEVGDSIRINTKNQRVESYVLQRVLSGIQSLKDYFETTSDKELKSKANSVHDEIVQLKGKTNTLKRTVESTVSEIKDLETKTNTKFIQTSEKIETLAQDIDYIDGVVETNTSNITQTAKDIRLEVERATGAEDALSGRIDVNAEQIALKVSQGDVQSMIDVSLKEIKITSDQISLEGYTTINKSFSIDNEGNIKATSGTIGGWNITSSGLEYDIYSVRPDSFYLGNPEGKLYFQGSTGLTIESGNLIMAGGDIYLSNSDYFSGTTLEDRIFGDFSSESVSTQTLSCKTIYLDGALLDVILSDLEDRIAALEG